MIRLLLSMACLPLTLFSASVSAPDPSFGIQTSDDRLSISWAGRPLAEYVFRDARILRPHFANIHVPGGPRVTRNHPPIQGLDSTDHDTMHPGLWLAFGDLNGQDFWRNRARIEHRHFLEMPRAHGTGVVFSAENRLVAAHGGTLGSQVSLIRITALPQGFLLDWQADFTPAAAPLVFGDQEEMGLGIRLATTLAERNGGVLRANNGDVSAKTTWGRSYAWCDSSGTVEGRHVGITLMPDPQNFRPSWFHNRDYGLMVANPFGRKAMNQGDPSQVVIEAGNRLRLRFGAYFYTADRDHLGHIAEAHQRFVQGNSSGPGADASREP